LSFSFCKTHNVTLVLTDLVVYLKCDVNLQDDQHKLEPWAHLLVGQRDVDSKHNAVGLNPLGNGLIEGPDLFTLVRTGRHEPFCFLSVLDCVHTLCGQVVDCCGGTGSWKDKQMLGCDIRMDVILKYCNKLILGPSKPKLPSK